MNLMKLKDEAGNAVMIAVVVVAVVVVAGVGVVVATHKSNKTTVTMAASSMTGITASEESLNNTLVTLGLQHMTLTDQAVDAALDGNKDATALATSLYANGNDIGAAVGSVYGSSAQTTFDSVWKLHLDQFVAYAEADAAGNATAKQTALNTINTGYTIPLSQYLAKANPNLPESTLQTLLSQHVAMTAMIIDDHVQGNYTKEQTDMNSADTMMTKIFSTLATAIAKQYPSKFNS
jgi:hypothetical protein